MCPAPRLACLSPLRWPGLDSVFPAASGVGLTLPCGPQLPFRAPGRSLGDRLRLGNALHVVTGSGRYAPCWFEAPQGAGFSGEATLWMLADGQVVVEPIAARLPALAAVTEVTLGAHRGADARAIVLQMAKLHWLQLGRGTHVDTPAGPRPVEALRPGMRVATLEHGPQAVAAVLPCRGNGRGRAAPWCLPPGFGGNTRVLIVAPHSRLLPPAAPWLPPAPVELLAPETGLTRAPAPAVDWIVLGFPEAQVIGLEGVFVATLPPAAPISAR